MSELQNEKDKVIGALIGLVKSCESHTPGEDTTALIMEGLLVASGDVDVYDREQLADLTHRIQEEKYSIVPNCRTCASPCGNTSDYDMEQIRERTPDRIAASQRLLGRLYEAAAQLPPDADMETALFLYQGLAAISFDWEPDELDALSMPI